MLVLPDVFTDTFICDMTHMNELKMVMSNLPLGSVLARYFERFMNILKKFRSPSSDSAVG